MKIEVKTISELVNDYVKGLDDVKNYHSVWPDIAGEQLARLTDFDRIENGVLYVKAKGSAASNLVVLRKRFIIYAFNRMFPEDKVSSIKVEVVY